LAALVDKGERNKQQEIFRFFLINTSPMEQKWIVRVIVKDLRLGVGQGLALVVDG
jgi:ATP-dependent DNA ligase